jgi:CheY-like chemotaxis protein
VLYVDDDEAHRELMEAVMRSRPQIKLLLADSGAEGEVLIRAAAPDLALVDMMLPDMSHAELLRRIRQVAG